MNWLAAASVALGFGIDMEAVVEAAATAEPPRGRLERIEQGQPFEVVVDFAHTPQALETTLAALRRLTHGKLYLVFGMAGERDASNRPVMGELAAKLSDFFVISSDDPGPEDPAAIAAEVAAGARGAGALEGTDYVIDLDRRSAVASVIQRARPGDAILLAGKGHERRMVLADGSVPWSDQDAAREALAAGGWK
jgi:UDP-N-acetylmuramoyl-L-alanyl-D-glutamate--2,6-diaminopimelate ligase